MAGVPLTSVPLSPHAFSFFQSCLPTAQVGLVLCSHLERRAQALLKGARAPFGHSTPFCFSSFLSSVCP